MIIDPMFDKEKMKNLDKLARSLEGKNPETINKAVDEAVDNATIDIVKTINEAFISSATAIAEKMLSEGRSIPDIITFTGLTKAEVLQIQSRLGYTRGR